MNGKIVAVDIDEVLSETLKSMLKKHKYIIKHRKVEWEELSNYNIWEIEDLGLSKNEAIAMFAQFQLGSGLFNKIEPVQWAKKNILTLKEKGYKFYAITARLTVLKPTTLLRLNKHFYGCFEKVIFANFFTKWEKKKSDICREIGASVIIEDNLETCIDCSKQGIKCYLFDKPRNQCENLPENIKRVYTWNEVDL